MKRIILTCAMSIGLLLGANAQNKSIDFKKEGTFTDHLAEAAKTKKLIFFDAYTSWCVPCKVLAKDVFTVDSVADFFNANFINVHYDMEKGEGLELKKRYESDISAFPTLLFINEKGEIVHKIVGAPNAKEFMELSKPALNPQLSLKGLAQKFEAGDRSVSTVTAYFKTLGTSNDAEKTKAVATAYFDALPTADLKKADVWALMSKYLFNIESKSFKYILDHKSEFNAVRSEASVDNYILSVLSREVSGLSMAYYAKKPVDAAKEAWLIKNLSSIHNVKAETDLLKVQLISSRNKGDWDNFNQLMTQMITAAKPIAGTTMKAAMLLNFTRRFTEAAPEGHLKDGLSWVDLLMKQDVIPPVAIDLLNFKKGILSKIGDKEGFDAADRQVFFQQKLKADAEQAGNSFPMSVKGFL
ncbi:thioredoxin family protein [Pedobacter frigoris]|uniref:thioredoxin family protein n=1 Tax=Pedobacter frigoris TaxID=2571272 RepID=UPI002931CD20|nr:thioredoxin family protein [Pedobacter frigoris]